MILSNPPMAFPRKRPHSGGENLKIQSPLLKNSFSGGTVLEITEDYTLVSTNPLTEGVFSDSVGVARLREFEQFAPYVHLLNGQEVLPDGHITGDILPSTRVGGFLLDPVARADKRDANCKTKFLHSDITPSEREAIQKGNPFDGSLAYRCNLDKTPGIWKGKPYQERELGPYRFFHYAMVPHGAATIADGAGFNLNSAPENQGGIPPVTAAYRKQLQTDMVVAREKRLQEA